MPSRELLSPEERQGMRIGKAMCPYCGVGCLIDVATKDNMIVELRGDPDSPVNLGLLCPKGALLGPVLDLPGRLVSPQRRSNRTDPFTDVTWDAALPEMTERLIDIIERYGPDSVALYG